MSYEFNFSTIVLLASIPLSAGANPYHLKQLTGLGGDAHVTEVADPAVSVQADGSVVVSGTSDVINGSNVFLKWPSLTSLVNGDTPKRIPVRLNAEVRVDGTLRTVPLVADEIPWDMEFYHFNSGTFLFAGVMSPRPGALNGREQDNISRRIRMAETKDQGRSFTFKVDPVFGTPRFDSWIGHSYGHQIIKDETSGKTYFFHDMISSTVDERTRIPLAAGGVNATEIFVREFDPKNPGRNLGRAKKILGILDMPASASHRLDGGYLLEGPRPRSIKIPIEGTNKTVSAHLLLFSTGDYPLKNYTIRAAVSTEGLLGPYQIYTENGQPADLGASIKKSKKLHALGRGFSFDYLGKPWIIFHAEADVPGLDYETTWRDVKRSLYEAPLQIFYQKDGKLRIKLVE